jgi:hypothetical protein
MPKFLDVKHSSVQQSLVRILQQEKSKAATTLKLHSVRGVSIDLISLMLVFSLSCLSKLVVSMQKISFLETVAIRLGLVMLLQLRDQ